jgi:uncharacterized protein with HEPN domain
MKDDIRAPLYDIVTAAKAVRNFVAGCSYEDYCKNDLLRSGVERKFEIMGEALSRIRRESPDSLGNIRQHRDIISFRNILAHGYDAIDDRIVWEIIRNDLGDLISDAERLLG